MIYIKGDYADIKDVFSKASIVCICHHNILASVGKYGKCEVGGEKLDLHLLTACWQQLSKTFAECFKSFLINFWDCLGTTYKTHSDHASGCQSGEGCCREGVCLCASASKCACEEKAAKMLSTKAWSWNNLGYRMIFAKEIEVDFKWWQGKSGCLRSRHLWYHELGWKSMSWWTLCTHREWLPAAQLDPCRTAAQMGCFPPCAGSG